MEVDLSRREWMGVGAVGLLSLATGCGTILHPERRNQPPGGNLDWGIVALDAVGLLLFFIPGIIAFAVDFSTGAIYLPAQQSYGNDEASLKDESLVTVEVPKKELTRQRVEEVTSRHTGREVRLVAGEYKTSRLTKLDEFWTTLKTLAAGRSGVSVCPESAGDCPYFAQQSIHCDDSNRKMGTVPLSAALSGQTLS